MKTQEERQIPEVTSYKPLCKLPYEKPQNNKQASKQTTKKTKTKKPWIKQRLAIFQVAKGWLEQVRFPQFFRGKMIGKMINSKNLLFKTEV